VFQKEKEATVGGERGEVVARESRQLFYRKGQKDFFATLKEVEQRVLPFPILSLSSG